MELEDWRAEFEDIGVNVAGMTYDSVEVLAAFHAGNALGYPLLRDVDAQHVLAYGVLNEEYQPPHRAYGIPHPGILLIRRDGTVLGKYAIPGYRRRPPLDLLLEDVAARLR